MSRRLHGGRGHALIVPDRQVGLLPRRWRLCPRCPGPVPPTGTAPARDSQRAIPILLKDAS